MRRLSTNHWVIPLATICVALCRPSLQPTPAFADEVIAGPVAHLRGKIQLHGLANDEVPVVTAVAIQPQGRLMATAGDDHIVRLWDLRSGRLFKELRGHKDWVTAVTFSRDGSEVVTGCRDRQVLIWDAASGRLKRQLGVHKHPITAIVISDQSDLVAIAGFRAPLKIYDLRTGKRMGSLGCPCTDIRAIAFSPATTFLAAAGRNGRIRIWNLAEGSKRDLKAHNQRVTSLVFASDEMLLSASEDKEVHLQSAATGDAVREYSGESGKVLSMQLLDNSRFAVATADNVIRLFSLDAPEPLTVLRGHTGSIAALDFRNHTLISGSFDTTVCVWSVAAPGHALDPKDKLIAPVAPPVASHTIPTSAPSNASAR